MIYNKKGNINIELLFLLLVVFIFVISTFTGRYILNELNDEAQIDTTLHNESKEVFSDMTNRYDGIMDNAFLLFFILIWVGMLIGASQIDTHPIFFVISIIVLIFLLIVAALIGNYYEELEAEDEFLNYGDSLPIIDYVMGHLVLFMLIIGSSIIIVLYGKSKVG